MYQHEEEHSDVDDPQQQHVENVPELEPMPALHENRPTDEESEEPLAPPDPHPEGGESQPAEETQTEQAEPKPPAPEAKVIDHRAEPSRPTDDVYIQMHQSFRRTNRQAFEKSQENLAKHTKPDINEQYLVGVRVAMTVQTMFHNFSMVMQGFLSGLAFGHAVFAFVFAEPDVLVRGYQWMAIPVQAAFYVCYTISAITALDRLETGSSLRETLQKFIALQHGGFGVIVWATGAVCSILTTSYDEYLASSDLDILTANNFRALIAWRSLSLARAICALIGWLLIALQPQANFTLEKLQKLLVGKSFF